METGILEQLRLQFRQLRGALLVLAALPLVPALLFSLIGGAPKPILGTLLGLGLLALAIRKLRRGHARSAGLLVGAATGMIAGTAGHVAPVAAVVFGAMAYFGTRLLYANAEPAEVEPPMPQSPPKAASAPPADLLATPRMRLAALASADARLRPALAALHELLLEMARRPEAGSEARRFLNLQLDGLERIDARLRLGAEPPESLSRLVEDMARGSTALRDRIRAEESAALEIQVKVLADRLREEGYA
ncbi:hypothetical protein E0493_00715 [Roseomonas sp. M0104]|uniref:Uncharacterized protein n=1 Tax=Teichococcus coralli TaxID=2545983 RepID=A0A845B6F8_9PROT|nr:hypothetical protein [Pseudoroseomonas coralli]MXP61870.1 hypothetical protein [Pseudoroseomonas coralli]